MQYRDSVFTIVRPDSDITVLPPRYVNELQHVDNHKLNPMEALSSVRSCISHIAIQGRQHIDNEHLNNTLLFKDMMGSYTGMSILTTSHLSFDAVQKKFTPKIGMMLQSMVDEVDYSLPKMLPPCRDWTEVDLSSVMTRVVSHLTARTWVGLELARTEDWHTVNLETTSNIFTTAIILKLLPAFLQPLVAPLLPTRWKLQQGLRQIHSYLIPLIEARARLADNSHERPEDMLQWMLDAAEGQEREPANLATRYVYAAIGSLFTVSAALVDCIYDLVAYPEHIEPLREEVRRVMKEDGGWRKGTPAKLELMDSFMKESQRVNASSPSMLNHFHAIILPPFHRQGAGDLASRFQSALQ